MEQTTRLLMCVALFVLVAAADVAGQTFTGGVRGEVSDVNGVIPGVAVTLTNEATSVSRDTVTNDVGQYNFPAVPPGTYSLKTELVGYRTVERTGLRVGTQQFLTIDLELQLGAIEETITVTGAAPLIDTSTASTGGTLDSATLDTLPTPGRNAFLVAVTVPTVMPTGDPQFNRQQDQTNASLISLGGGGIRANNYLLDGVPITEMSGRAVLNPTIEAVDDIKVQVHTYDSEMGRTGGGVFNVTAKAGTNRFRGTGFYQTRPVWGQSLNFFSKLAGETKETSGVSDSYYRLYGGGIGGPVVRNRTFFWAATEGYRSLTTRALNYIWPSLNQRTGDFSGSTIGGQPVRLFNPWCRGGVASARCPATGTGSLATGGAFTNAVIPLGHPAVSPAGLNLINAWPTRTVGGADIASNEDNNPNARDTARLVDAADMLTFKVEHKFTDNWSLSGLYLYNRTNEPGSGIMPAEFEHIENQAEFFTTLRRRPHVLVFNNTNVLNDTTVLALRYGWTTWQDQTDKSIFSPGLASLGFGSAYANGLAENDVFPDVRFDDVHDVGGWGGSRRRWDGTFAINGALTKLMGTHSLKVGGDARQLGITTTTVGAISGRFDFDDRFTSSRGVAGSGHELASLLLGLPASGLAPANRGEGKWFTRYYSAYVQDDWRASSRFTLNYGLRFEHEDGLREDQNRQTVAFDRDDVSPIDALVPKTGLLAGRTITGGLIFAGVNGAPEEQGDPPSVKVSPRVGATFSVNNDTVIRGGYGIFYAPWQYSTTEHGQEGFARNTELNQSAPERDLPITTLDDPFPEGLQQPFGSSLGLLQGVGGDITFIDQNKGAPRVHQYSVDVQRELPGDMAITIGYTGATGRDLGYGGSGTPTININQIDPEVARRVFPAAGGGWDPAALRNRVPNPFFGIAEAGELGALETVEAGQLLRPFPQFRNVNMAERTEGGRRQFHSAIFQLDKRATGLWGGRFSYTWSNTKDNQFGQGGTFTTITNVPQNNYNLDAEYGTSNFDSPHRIILAPIVRLPEPAGGGLTETLLGGWMFSAIVELVSGSPLNAAISSSASDANLGLFGGRQRPNLVGDPSVSGGDQDRVSTATNPDARWFDSSAYQNPGAGQYGSASRTNPDARLQFRKNVDLMFAKQTRIGAHSAEVRFELLNLTNTPKFGGAANNPNLTSFGRIQTQRGFSRIWQLSFRYRF